MLAIFTQATWALLTFPVLQWSAANFVASRTHRTSIPSTYDRMSWVKKGGEKQFNIKPAPHVHAKHELMGVAFVSSIIHEHQTAGWMLTPATARMDCQRPPVIVLVHKGHLQATGGHCSFRPRTPDV